MRALDVDRALPKKMCFYAQQGHWFVADLKKKQLISGDKKKSEKNKFISGDKKTFFHLRFFFFSSPSLTFPKYCPMFFIWSPSLHFSKIGSMFFFCPPSLDLSIFSDLTRGTPRKTTNLQLNQKHNLPGGSNKSV